MTFFKIGTKCGKNKKYGPKWEFGQNLGTKIAFPPKSKRNKIIIIIIIILKLAAIFFEFYYFSVTKILMVFFEWLKR